MPRSCDYALSSGVAGRGGRGGKSKAGFQQGITNPHQNTSKFSRSSDVVDLSECFLF